MKFHEDFAFPASRGTPPTSNESQSKLWYNDGVWWGVLLEPTTSSFHIYGLDSSTDEWVDTGVLVDERPESGADVLWDGEHLYVVTGGNQPTRGESARLVRYSYDSESRTYRLDPNFPVQITETGVKWPTIAKDSTGVLWVASISDNQVIVIHSREADEVWGAPFVMPGPGSTVASDVATVVSYAAKIGVVWSNQIEGAIYFASHTDGDPELAWTTTAVISGPEYADDHMSVRSLDGPNGTSVFVAAKTSLDMLPGAGRSDPQMLLLELDPSGSWHSYVYGQVQDRHTQPLLLIDEEHLRLYFFAVSPFGRGAIYYKRTPVDEIVFPPGKGSPFIDLPESPSVSNPTSTKQNLSGDTNLLVLAADEATKQYVHGLLLLDDHAS